MTGWTCSFTRQYINLRKLETNIGIAADNSGSCIGIAADNGGSCIGIAADNGGSCIGIAADNGGLCALLSWLFLRSIPLRKKS